ncbi:MAG: hypothetical protein H6565_04505 [Lewinellaceae bacterium]|nr:hypothetical protein [Saprospiraceae bacterium]MCB9305834.1 hypothetical protein [Lewinellaceae bacterium]
MKKALYLLVAVLAAASIFYACQKEQNTKTPAATDPGIPVVPQSATDRSYSDCSECAENCNDCCLIFLVEAAFTEWAPGDYAMLVYKHPADATHWEPYYTNELITYGSSGIRYICAMGGWVQIVNVGASTSRIRTNVTICGGGGSIALDSYGYESCTAELTWDCQWSNWQDCND